LQVFLLKKDNNIYIYFIPYYIAAQTRI